MQNPLFCLTLSRLPKRARRVLEKGSSSDGNNTGSIIMSNEAEVNDLLASLPIIPKHKAAAKFGILKQCIQSVPCVFSEQQCSSLRQWAAEKLTEQQTTMDTVDGCPEYQVPIDQQTLTNIVGKDTVRSLWQLPLEYLMEAADFESTNIANVTVDLDSMDVGCFIRKYTSSGRPFLGFHVDDCDATVNVCLSHSNDHQGGELIALSNRTVASVGPRNIGAATVHPWYCCHGVSAVTAGERWSLIAFFSNTYPPLHKQFYDKVFYQRNEKKQRKSKRSSIHGR